MAKKTVCYGLLLFSPLIYPPPVKFCLQFVVLVPCLFSISCEIRWLSAFFLSSEIFQLRGLTVTPYIGQLLDEQCEVHLNGSIGFSTSVKRVLVDIPCTSTAQSNALRSHWSFSSILLSVTKYGGDDWTHFPKRGRANTLCSGKSIFSLLDPTLVLICPKAPCFLGRFLTLQTLFEVCSF